MGLEEEVFGTQETSPPSPTPVRAPEVKTVTGTLASVLAPKAIREDKKKTIEDEVFDDFKQEKGYSPPRPQVIIPPLEAKKIAEAPKSLEDEVFSPTPSTLFVMGNDPATQLALNAKAGAERLGKKAFTGVIEPTLEILSVDEAVIAAGISKAMGYPKRDRLLDYNYHGLLLDAGLPDNISTTSLAFGLSFYASPLNYITFGGTGVARIAGGMGRLTKKGLELVSQVKKERLMEALTQAENKLHYFYNDGKWTRRSLTEKETKEITQKVFSEVDNELVNKMQMAQKQITDLKQGKDVKDLPGHIFDYGGIGWQVPFSSTKRTLVSGETLKKVIVDSGLAKLNSYAEKAGKAFLDVLPDRLSENVVAAYRDTIGNSLKALKALKETFGKTFIHNYGKPSEILDIIEDTMIESRRAKGEALKEFEGFFMGMDKAQLEDFAESAIYHNVRFPDEKVKVTSLAGDVKVQDKLDRFYAQGEFKGTKSYPQIFKERLGKYASLIEETERPQWFPGIMPEITLDTIHIKESFRDWKFLKEPNAKKNEYLYTRNPIQALSVRMTQIAYARLQDKAYESAVKQGFGEMISEKAYKALSENKQSEYAVFRAPFASYLLDGADKKDRAKLATYYVKKEFLRDWESEFTPQRFKRPQHMAYSLASGFMSTFKKGVTLLSPPYYLRNFNGNIVFNAYSMGISAFDPKKAFYAYEMIRGKNLGKILVTEAGEKVTLAKILEEGKTFELTGQHGLIFDLEGSLLKGEQKTAWDYVKNNWLNPLSPDFQFFKHGAKFSGAIEDQARMVNYLHWRLKGADPRSAAMEAKTALLDYHQISDFEKTWMNLLVPFYSFQRKNLQKHIDLFARRPAMTADFVNLMANFGPSAQDWNGLPDHVKNKVNLKFDNMMLTGFGFGIEDALQNLSLDSRTYASKLSPLFRVPLEKAFDKDLVQDRDLGTVNSAQEFKFAVQWSEQGNWLQKKIGQRIVDWIDLQRDQSEGGKRKDKITGDPYTLHLLRALPSARWQTTLGQMQKTDETKMQALFRLTLGLIQLTPDEEKMVTYRRQRVAKEGKKEVVRKRLGFEIPHVISTNPDNQEYLDEYVNEVMRDKEEEYKRHFKLDMLEERRKEKFKQLHERQRP